MAKINTNPRKGVSHFSIFDYWKDKAITKTGEIVLAGDEYADPPVFVVEFDFEPSCWGCGLPVITELEKKSNQGAL